MSTAFLFQFGQFAGAVRVAPVTFLAPVVFASVVVATAPARDVLVWEDGETLSKDEDWTEFTLNCDARGTKLWYEVVGGKVQADWAEVVFENGDAQVVDFAEKTHGAGLYSLLDFKDGRKVDAQFCGLSGDLGTFSLASLIWWYLKRSCFTRGWTCTLSGRGPGGPRVDRAAAFKLVGNLLLMALAAGFADMLALGRAMNLAPEEVRQLFDFFTGE